MPTPNPEDELDLAVVRSLAKLTDGRLTAFASQVEPPEEIAGWLAGASSDQARGLLCLALRRWHELGGN